jgi:hypothetical protein
VTRRENTEAVAMCATAGAGTLAFATGHYFTAVGILALFAVGWSLDQAIGGARARRTKRDTDRHRRIAEAAAAADQQAALRDVDAFRELMRAAGARELEDR